MVTSQLRRHLRIMLRYEDPQKVLVIHVGANDLGNLKTKNLGKNLIQVMTLISKDLPDIKIVWSQMLPRLKWRYSSDIKAMEKCRYSVNNAVANYILESGPPDDLDDSKKRWLVVGICLHTIISPVLRNYVVPVVTKLWYSLTRDNKINQQTFGSYLKRYAPTNTELNYEAINSNKTMHGRNGARYDYKVKSPVDLSRLFIQTHMAHFTAFDDSCDSSALLGLIVNIDRFPAVVQSNAIKIRSDIRNPWAHCDFTEWTTTKYADSFQLMGQLITNLRLSNREENRILGELNRWATNGQNFLSGTRLDLEIMNEIRQQTHILSEYAKTVRKETDSQFANVQKELSDLATKYKELAVKLQNLETEIQKQDEDPIPKNIQEQIKNLLEDWEKNDKMFVTTRASDYVMECVQNNSCVTLTAPSGAGKSFISRHTALILQKEGYNIIPVYSPTDLRTYYRPGKQTVFIVDDICGNFTANQQHIDSWKQLLPVINTIIGDKCCKIIVSYKICLTSEEKNIIAKTYIGTLVDNIEEIELSQNNEFFPLLCSLYHGVENGDVKEFFNNPFNVYKNELDNLSMRDDDGNYKICSLALLVLFNNQLEEKWFQGKVTDGQRHIIEDTCEACEINRSTSKAKLKKALDTLDGTFICKQNGNYRSLHDKLFDFLARYFGQKMIECLINHGDSDLVHERFSWQKSPDDKNSNIDFIIEIPDDYLESYLDRLIKDWSAGKVNDVFSNNNINVLSFRQQLLHHLKQLDQTDQEALASTKDTVIPKEECGSGTNPLIDACYEGYSDMVQWLLHNCVDVDHCRDDGSTGLGMASWDGHKDIVKLLLEKNPQVDLCDKYGYGPLCIASQEGHTDIVKLLLEKNPNIDLLDKNGCSPLYMASWKGHADIVKLLLEKNPNINLCNHDSCSPLYIASWEGHTEIVKLLLEKNPNVDLCDKYGWSPLFMASCGGHTDIVKLLLEKSPNIDLCNSDGFSPLYMASWEGYTDIVKLLLEKNPNIDLCNSDGCSPLYMVSLEGHTDIVKLLLQKNANVDLFNNDGCTPLYIASCKGHTDTVNLLLEKDPKIDLCNSDGCSPLYIASWEGHTDIVKLLLEKNPKIDLCNSDDCSPLYMASWEGHTDIVKLLLEKNPNIDLCSSDGCSPLYMASWEGHTDIVKLLLEKNPNIDLCNSDGWSPLYMASWEGHTDIVKLLLEKNHNIDLCSRDGCSPLYMASQEGHTDIVKLLLEKNPNVDLCDKYGWSPLFMASCGGHTDIVKLLLEKNPNIDLCNTDDCSPLYMASWEGHNDIVKLLLEKNPNIDLCSSDGCSPLYMASWEELIIDLCNSDDCSPLYMASWEGHTDIVKLLLEKNPNIDLCSSDGCSPLYMASWEGHTDIVKLLLEKNPNIDLCNSDGCSPLYMASCKGNTDTVKLLLKKNPKIDLCNNDGCSPLYMASQEGHTDIEKLLLEKNHNVDQCDKYC
ncbi:unnamed protein product [Mytilus coruscus]|uniref:Novel STAND NTPase 3 domain-containing protein n=1 Tax=Mytilus coruscus TaxID=42192 RepID=A0A6J8AS66_MYTCO|nr:unnamed protein product [Mytilus coruscus]